MLHEYTKGDMLLAGGDASTAADCLVLSQSYLVMFYTAQLRLVLTAIARSKLVMQLKGKLARIPAKSLIDSGAGFDVLSQEFPWKHRLSMDIIRTISETACQMVSPAL